MKYIDVAVAVIHYQDKYLLGYRSSHQHQGDRYEFVGGKIEASEQPKQALIREVYEEIGLDITSDGCINPLGVLRHEYLDISDTDRSKTVCLHVFRVQLSPDQFAVFRDKTQGCEGQRLHWVSKQRLLDNQYVLPEANQSILQWLRLDDVICITNQLSFNDTQGLDAVTEQSLVQWLEYHHQSLPQSATVYVRLASSSLKQQARVLLKLCARRTDLNVIIQQPLADYLSQTNKLPVQVIAQHLTQAMLEHQLQQLQQLQHGKNTSISQLSLPITVSCHSQYQIQAVNILAQYQLNHKLAPVIGAYLSPVQPTQTHPEQPCLGWEQFAILAEHCEVPVIALGGLAPQDLATVRRNNGDKVAGIRQFLTQEHQKI